MQEIFYTKLIFKYQEIKLIKIYLKFYLKIVIKNLIKNINIIIILLNFLIYFNKGADNIIEVL